MKRGNKKRKSGFFIIALSVLLLCGIIVYKERDLLNEKNELKKEASEIQAKIEEEERRTEELTAKQAYMQTVRYVEDVAREKLGLVYEDEIIFRTEDDKD